MLLNEKEIGVGNRAGPQSWSAILIDITVIFGDEANTCVIAEVVEIIPKFNLGTDSKIYGTTAYRDFKVPLEIRYKW